MRKNVSNAPNFAGPDMNHNPNFVQNRILQYAEENPDSQYYPLADAVEASELLLALAAVLQLQIRSMPRGPDRQERQVIANQMRKAVRSGSSVEYLGELGELVAFGLKIQLPGQFATAGGTPDGPD